MVKISGGVSYGDGALVSPISAGRLAAAQEMRGRAGSCAECVPGCGGCAPAKVRITIVRQTFREGIPRTSAFTFALHSRHTHAPGPADDRGQRISSRVDVVPPTGVSGRPRVEVLPGVPGVG